MKSGRHVLLDFLLNFVVYSNFLTVNNFFYSLAVSVLAGNFSSNFYSLEVIFLFYTESDQTFSDFTDLFSLSFGSNDLAICQK